LADSAIAGLNDSKKLSAKKRGPLEARIMAEAHWAIGVVEADEIDRINIFAATMLAMTRAVAGLVEKVGEPAMVLIDGNKTPQGRVADWRWAARAIVGAMPVRRRFQRASIIAKEHRDRVMRNWHWRIRIMGGTAMRDMARRSIWRRCVNMGPRCIIGGPSRRLLNCRFCKNLRCESALSRH
jgi:ribonuclease HII